MYGINRFMIVFTACCAALFAGITTAQDSVPAAPNGIQLPQGYKDWRVISSSHREDNKTLRVILGNDKAIGAARAGKTNPWPDGTILGKLVWKDASHPQWEKATVPGKFVHAEFMVKDAKNIPLPGAGVLHAGRAWIKSRMGKMLPLYRNVSVAMHL